MKNFTIPILFSLIIFGSCKDNTTEKTDKYVNLYTTYVDSIIKLPLKDAANNWAKIQDKYQNIKIDVDVIIQDINDKKNIEKRRDSFSSLFKEYRKKVLIESEKLNLESAKLLLAKSLFGKQYRNDKRAFKWVNNDNISSVYNNFYENTKANEDSYLKEDWEEIKMLYQELESRRKTIEELTDVSFENKNTIKEINLKFATLFSLNKTKEKQ